MPWVRWMFARWRLPSIDDVDTIFLKSNGKWVRFVRADQRKED